MSEADRHEQDFGGKYTQANALTRRLLNRFFLAIGKLLEELEVESALEIGCGFGFSTARLREMLAPEVALEASDVEERLVRAAAAANPGMPIRIESVYQLDRPDRSFDCVLALEVLEHLQEPARAMREVCRVSRRWIIVSVPREPIWRILNLARLKYVSRLGNTPGHVQHWSAGGFKRFVQQFCHVRAVCKAMPWTIVLGEV